MTYAHISGGGVVHFPPFGSLRDSVSVIEPPAPDLLLAIAAMIRPGELMSFSRRLLNAASKRRCNPRWEKVNLSRIVLAQLCLDRALGAMSTPAQDDGADAGLDEIGDYLRSMEDKRNDKRISAGRFKNLDIACRCSISPFLGRKPIAAVTAADVEDWYPRLVRERGLKPVTAKGRVLERFRFGLNRLAGVHRGT